MGLLKNTRYYLCGNLENTSDAFEWREFVTKELDKLGTKCFDPNLEHFINQPTEADNMREVLREKRVSQEWDFIHSYMKSVVSRDLRYVDLSTFLICNIEPDLPTYGTTWELCIAHQQRKPVLFHIHDKRRFPLWLSGLYKMDFVYEDWGSLINYIYKIDSQEIYADPKYWKILVN